MELQLSRMIAKFAKQSSADAPASDEDIIQECVLDLMELAREALDVLTGSFTFRVSVERWAPFLLFFFSSFRLFCLVLT